MTEPHQALAPIQFGTDDGFRAFGSADFEHHVECRTRRAAMQGTFQRPDGAGDGRNDVGSRRGDHSCRKGGGIETVIADGVEIRFQRAGPFG